MNGKLALLVVVALGAFAGAGPSWLTKRRAAATCPHSSLCGYAPGVVRLVIVAERADSAVITLPERGAPWFAKARDHCNSWRAHSAANEFIGLCVLENAEEPELLACGPVARTS